uniref:Uncharacterized protein n=1 Tax=Olive latent virus 2 (isolate Italy) TaxID=650489 RepID=Q83945_OLV2I|nr:unknown function 7K protein [Olive latent virus 2]
MSSGDETVPKLKQSKLSLDRHKASWSYSVPWQRGRRFRVQTSHVGAESQYPLLVATSSLLLSGA